MISCIKKGISLNVLKYIAVFTMICDHIGYRFLEQGVLKNYDLNNDVIQLLATPSLREFVFLDAVLRGVGRVGYPLFAYLVVIGFLNTGNIYNYIKRMLLFAIASEIPFDLFWSNHFIDFGHQNVLFTYSLGMIAMLCIDRMWDKKLCNRVIVTVSVALCIVAGHVLHVDYDFVGVLVVIAFYIFRNKPMYRDSSVVVSLTMQYIFDFISVISIIFIHFCNGKYTKSKKIRLFFYWFYPLHMLILYLIEEVIIKWHI